MITVKELKRLLAFIPDDAQIHAYEGESVGLAIELGDKEWWINSSSRDEQDEQDEFFQKMPAIVDDMPEDYVPSQFFNLSRPMGFECIDCNSKIVPLLEMQIWYPEKRLLVKPLCVKCFNVRMADTQKQGKTN